MNASTAPVLGIPNSDGGFAILECFGRASKNARPKLALGYLPPFPAPPELGAFCAAADCARAPKLPLLTWPPLLRAVALWMRDAAADVIGLLPLFAFEFDLLILLFLIFGRYCPQIEATLHSRTCISRTPSGQLFLSNRRSRSRSERFASLLLKVPRESPPGEYTAALRL
jgi:hypothetical protein